jgi:hypothetical protein
MWFAGIAAAVTLVCIAIVLAQIQRRLAGADRKLDALLRHLNIAAPGLGLSDRVRALARDPAKKIEAIKAHREETGAELAEARQVVEDYINSTK